MNKITLLDFWNSRKELGIHCKTLEEAQKICEASKKLLFENRLRPFLGYPEYKEWNICKNNAYLTNDSLFKYGSEGLEETYEFGDIIFNKPQDLNDLIERDKPKMINYKIDGTVGWQTVAFCPNCNRLFGLKGDFKFNFCLNCGQRLKWEND